MCFGLCFPYKKVMFSFRFKDKQNFLNVQEDAALADGNLLPAEMFAGSACGSWAFRLCGMSRQIEEDEPRALHRDSFGRYGCCGWPSAFLDSKLFDNDFRSPEPGEGRGLSFHGEFGSSEFFSYFRIVVVELFSLTF